MPLQHYRQALSPGFRLFWYEIERVLGQGGFGITYQARDTNLDRSVAIKEYLPVDIARRGELGEVEPRSAGDTELYQRGMARFLVEAKTLNRFDHPNIVRVYSVFEANSTAYMVMRYEQGEALSELLDRVKTLPEAQLLAIARPLLDGLAQIHAAGFIHRDVQPANIYLRSDGTPVLLDFGAAREATSGARTMTILVAPGYAPIEQYYAHGEQGPWTDIYGLAASLYRAIAGTPPIDAIERSRGILGSTRDMLVPALVTGHGRYSTAFLAAIDHALMFNEHERPPSAAAWADELAGQIEVPLLAAQAVESPPADPTEHGTVESTAPIAPPSRRALGTRRMARVLALAVGVVALAVLVIRLDAVDLIAAQLLARATRSPPATTAEGLAAPSVNERRNTELEVADRRIAALESEVKDLSAKLRATEADLGNAGPKGTKASTGAGETAPTATKDKVATSPVTENRTAKPAAVPLPPAAPISGRQPELPGAAQHEASAQTRVAAVPVKKVDASAPVAPAASPPPANPPPAPNDTARARDLLARADYSAARALLLNAATNGVADAQFLLAQVLEDARTGPVDPGAALEWKLRAARQGVRDAQVGVARAYRPGPGGLMNEPFLAYTWFVVAEQNGAIDIAQEREQVGRLLQPEQLPQALALASALRSSATRP